LAGLNPLVLANNDPARVDYDPAWQFTPAVFNSGGLNQQLGTLTLAGTEASVVRAIDFAQGSGTLSFADSSAQDWSGFTLTINNYAVGRSKLRFGTSSSGLTAAQLSQIRFPDLANLPGVIDGNGFVTPALPKITRITRGGGAVKLVWSAVSGRTYRVWSKAKLNTGSWGNPSDVWATDITASYSDPSPSPAGRVYRVEVLP
jgi:hypothetical protein